MLDTLVLIGSDSQPSFAVAVVIVSPRRCSFFAPVHEKSCILPYKAKAESTAGSWYSKKKFVFTSLFVRPCFEHFHRVWASFTL